MRWYLDEHVDMLFGQNARDDLYPQFLANLPNDGSYPLAQCSFQNFIAILGDPDDVVAMVKNGVTSGCIAHRLKNGSSLSSSEDEGLEPKKETINSIGTPAVLSSLSNTPVIFSPFYAKLYP